MLLWGLLSAEVEACFTAYPSLLKGKPQRSAAASIGKSGFSSRISDQANLILSLL